MFSGKTMGDNLVVENKIKLIFLLKAEAEILNSPKIIFFLFHTNSSFLNFPPS